ncbi:antitoxin [Corynebacterium sphenisci]|uniref:antitoxin n=1 Tax=Corynebacterium sphenisci TaxID=191493 RepID=UPI0026E10DD4|nr:antitoxin [Corynebacterium sphenisci]MDO5732099.1 antitoxin [Corynebacterium sphenisci]
MGFLDKARQFASKNPDKVKQGLEKAGDAINERTGGKYADAIDKATDVAADTLGGGAPAAEEEGRA